MIIRFFFHWFQMTTSSKKLKSSVSLAIISSIVYFHDSRFLINTKILELKWRLFLGLLTWINHCYLLKKAFCNSADNGRRWRYIGLFARFFCLARSSTHRAVSEECSGQLHFFHKKMKNFRISQNYGHIWNPHAKWSKTSTSKQGFCEEVLEKHCDIFMNTASFCIETRAKQIYVRQNWLLAAPRHITCMQSRIGV